MTLLDDPRPDAPVDLDVPRDIVDAPTRGDKVFTRLAQGAGLSSLVLMGLIATLLLVQGWPALREAGPSFFTTLAWSPDSEPAEFGVAAMMYGTFVIALIGLVIAIPLALGSALFINEIAPRRLQRPLTAMVDLLAAVPSLIFGMWGRDVLQPRLYGTFTWMADHLTFIPFFRADQRTFAASLMMSGIVVSLMIIPLAASIMRQVFSQAPPLEREGALALGSTRWGMIRTVVLPYGRGGIIGGSMLGLGRALGETIAVALILSPSYTIQTQVLEPGGASVASTIANEFSEATPFGLNALMAAGLALFVVTFIVNMGANVIVSRSRSGTGVEI